MKKVKLSFERIWQILTGRETKFPPYVSPLLNLANRFAQATRPQVVGQMSDLIREFPGKTLEEWEKWYLERKPDAINEATERIAEMLRKFRETLDAISEETIKDWVKDLVIVKTFIGLRFQEAILYTISRETGKEYRVASREEESKGIDGYIGNTPVSIKPKTYEVEAKRLAEDIKVPVIYYVKTKDGIYFEYNPDDFR